MTINSDPQNRIAAIDYIGSSQVLGLRCAIESNLSSMPTTGCSNLHWGGCDAPPCIEQSHVSTVRYLFVLFYGLTNWVQTVTNIAKELAASCCRSPFCWGCSSAHWYLPCHVPSPEHRSSFPHSEWDPDRAHWLAVVSTEEDRPAPSGMSWVKTEREKCVNSDSSIALSWLHNLCI